MEVEIKKIGINGEGIGYVERKITFVKGALPGEVCDIVLTKRERGYNEGKIKKIIKRSPYRVTSTCKQYRDCQGCSLLHCDYLKGLEYKKAMIRESFEKYIEDYDRNIPFSTIPCTKKTGYLDVLEAPAVTFKDHLMFGIYQRNSRYAALMKHCQKLNPVIIETIDALQKALSNCKVYNDRTKLGIRYAKFRCINDKVQLILITGKDQLKQETVKELQKIHTISSCYISVNTTKYQDFEDQGYTKLFGTTKLKGNYEDIHYEICAKTSLPANSLMEDKIRDTVRELCKNSENILSINSGLALCEMAMHKPVTCLFDSKFEQVDASENKKINALEQIHCVIGKIDDKIKTQTKKHSFDTVIVYMNRDKMSHKVKESVSMSKAKKIILIGDVHSSLAKDINDLSNKYHVSSVTALDSDPYTSYMTTIAVLEQNND